jgi:translation initiation factor IF-3
MIKVSEVNVIDSEGEALGNLPIDAAMNLAEERGMDLVEVAPEAKPPVCRIMDFGKHKYRLSKRAHEAKKNQKITHVKEIKFRPKTGVHDYNFKMRNITKFLDAGDKVKVVIFFKGREIVHRDQGEKILQRVIKDIDDFGVVEQTSRQEGRTLMMILAPKKSKPATKAEQKAATS